MEEWGSDSGSRSGSAAVADEEFEPPGSATVPANATGLAPTQRSDERPREAPVAASPPRAPSVPPPRRTAEASRGGCQRARSLEAGREVPAASPGFCAQEAVAAPLPVSKVPTINVPPMVTTCSFQGTFRAMAGEAATMLVTLSHLPTTSFDSSLGMEKRPDSLDTSSSDSEGIYIPADSGRGSTPLDWKAWGTALKKVWGASDWHFGGIYIATNSDRGSIFLDWKAWGTALEKVWGASDWHFGGRGSLGIAVHMKESSDAVVSHMCSNLSQPQHRTHRLRCRGLTRAKAHCRGRERVASAGAVGVAQHRAPSRSRRAQGMSARPFLLLRRRPGLAGPRRARCTPHLCTICRSSHAPSRSHRTSLLSHKPLCVERRTEEDLQQPCSRLCFRLKVALRCCAHRQVLPSHSWTSGPILMCDAGQQAWTRIFR
eukprot:s245_g8.t1